jgi:molybdate/tungstate transport system substrate-binding protein
VSAWRFRYFLAAVVGLANMIACTDSASVTAPQKARTKLVVFEAGSLMVPFAQIEKEFEAANPDIDVEIQAHGSIQVIRHVTELGYDIDVVAVADSSLIPMLMYRTPMADGKPYADWYIEPATNELVLAYTAKSKYAEQINEKNWYDIISREEVRLGLADPRMDAVGYRTIMVVMLAEDYYSAPAILADAIGNSFGAHLREQSAGGLKTVTVPELLEPAGRHLFMRGASMQLISLLESNDIDYTFEYKSMVEQHNLKYLELPPQINLSDKSFASNYAKVTVKLDFRRFKSVQPEFSGLPIEYGITIPANSKHKEEAVRFIQFVLGQEGQRIFNENHHPPLIPPECDNINALPDALKSYFR